MKKLLLFCVIAAIVLMTGCKTIDPSYVIECIYANNSSLEITVYVDRVNPYDINTRFVIPAGKSHTLLFGDAPLSISDYVTVSNGEKTITHTRTDRNYTPNSLYDRQNYTLVSRPKEYYEVLLYIFDDNFFENDELVEY